MLGEVYLIFKSTQIGPIKQQSSQTGEMVLVLLREEMSGKRRCGGSAGKDHCIVE